MEKGQSLVLEAPGWRTTLRQTVPGAQALRRLTANVGATVGVGMLAALVLVALFANVVSPYDPVKINLADSFRPPSPMHLAGTDELGRDVFSRVVSGTRVSFWVVIIVLLVASTIGVPLGAVAGYWGSPIDDIIMRITDIFLAFPSFILAMAIAAALGRSLEFAVLSVGIASWPTYARLIRGQILSTKNEAYVDAARVIGATQFRIVLVHVLPNCIVPFIIQLSMDAGSAILATAALSFVGLGAQPPTPEWGAMVSNGRQFITTHWWIPTFPGLAISYTVATFIFLGDGLRDLLDPRLKYLFNR